MYKKILSLILAAVMTASILVSCKSGGDSSNTSSSTVEAVTDPEILAINDYLSDLAEQFNYDGVSFTYVGEGGQTAEYEEETGNIENDALYFRQRELEELFGITWQSKKITGYDDGVTTNLAVFVKEAVMAGQQDYDLVYGNPISVGAVLFVENSLMDVSGFSTVNLEKEWWNASLPERYSFAGRMFFLTGSAVTNYFGDSSCILFNKEVLEDYGIEEPYSFVKDGSWTFDKMFELASTVPLNTSGSGTYRYGEPNGLAILFAHGYGITSFDDEGNPYVEASLPMYLSDIADKYSVIMSDDVQSVHLKGLNGMGHQEDYNEKYGYEGSEEMFADGRILFQFATTGTAADLRKDEVLFGIVPVPKGDASQESYYSFANNWSSSFIYVPRCTKDIQMVDVIIEAMGALGHKHIKPAYYDKILKGRSIYDSDSKEMIDIVFENKIYDMADMYAGGNIHTPGKFISAIKYAIDDDSSSLATNYFVYSKLANRQIDKLKKSLESFD